MFRITLVLVLLGGCSNRPVDRTIPLDETFDRTQASGEALERYQDAAAYSEAHGGVAFLVLDGQTVVYEIGQNGHASTEAHPLYSGTKSFTCALFAAAQHEGLVSAEESVTDTLPELEVDGLTVDHLLHLTSGVRQPRGLSLDQFSPMQMIRDKTAYMLRQPFEDAPGEVFAYGPGNFLLFTELMERKLDADPLDWLRDQVLDPIGLRTFDWARDPSDHPSFAAGASTTVGEWAKYGALVRDDGVFDGRRILPPGALAGCMEGSAANPAYGRTFWLNQPVDRTVDLTDSASLESEGPLIWADGPDDLVMAAGARDQRLYILPGQDLVVVRLSSGEGDFRDAELLRRLLPELE